MVEFVDRKTPGEKPDCSKNDVVRDDQITLLWFNG
jgi:hypothetical protein